MNYKQPKIWRRSFWLIAAAEKELQEIHKEPVWKDAYIKEIAAPQDDYGINAPDETIFIIKIGNNRYWCNNNLFMKREDL